MVRITLLLIPLVLKTGKIYENAEKYGVIRAINAIERSDVVLVVLDGTKDIEEQDKRIAGLAVEANRAVIFVVNNGMPWKKMIKR